MFKDFFVWFTWQLHGRSEQGVIDIQPQAWAWLRPASVETSRRSTTTILRNKSMQPGAQQDANRLAQRSPPTEAWCIVSMSCLHYGPHATISQYSRVTGPQPWPWLASDGWCWQLHAEYQVEQHKGQGWSCQCGLVKNARSPWQENADCNTH